MGYQKILVPLDGSDLAERAIPYARTISQMKGSEVVLFTVSRASGEKIDLPMQAYLDIKGKELEVQRVKTSTALAYGNEAEEIIEFADQNKIDLLIISTHGHSGIKRWLLGSVANKLLSGTSVPVLLVKSRAHQVASVAIEKILVPLDGSPPPETSLRHIEELVKGTEVEIFLLRVVEPVILPTADFPAAINSSEVYRLMAEEQQRAQKYLGDVTDIMASKGLKVRSQLAIGKAAESIVEAAEKENVDLIAMTTHGRTGVIRWVAGSVTSRVQGESRQPVLLIRPSTSEEQST